MISSSGGKSDGHLIKCKLGDHAGNDHGTIEPPKASHIKKDLEKQRQEQLKKRMDAGFAL